LYSHIEKQICEKILKGFNSPPPPLLNLGQTLILTHLIAFVSRRERGDLSNIVEEDDIASNVGEDVNVV